jgi:hypothetical protein
MAAWQGIVVSRYRYGRACCESYRSNGKVPVLGSMQARVSEVIKEWDLTRRESSSLCHASTGDGNRKPGNVEWKEMVKSPSFDRPGLAIYLQQLLASTCIGLH